MSNLRFQFFAKHFPSFAQMHTPTRKSNCASTTKSDTRNPQATHRLLLRMETHLYTEPGCGACIEAKSFLKSRGISFEEQDVRANPEYLLTLTEELGSCILPTLVAGDTIVAGFDRGAHESLPAAVTLKLYSRSGVSELLERTE
jgi:glutaredoxin